MIRSSRLLAPLVFVALAALPAEAQRGRSSEGPLPEWARESWFFRRQIETPIALVEANVIDVASGEVQEGAHVVLRGGRIVSVGYDDPPDEAEIVDARGLFLVPGFLDLHAHVIPPSPFYPTSRSVEATLLRLVEHGVTAIRCLPLASEPAAGWNARIMAGELSGPSMVVSGPVFERVPQRTSFGFGDPETAAEWVRREALVGSRWIKVYNAMDAPSLTAIVETAHELGLRVCGHTEQVPPHEASRLGMDCVEHMVSIPLSCLRADVEPPARGGAFDLLALTAWRWENYDDEAGRALMETFRDNGTAWVPTLVVTERIIDAQGHDGVSQTDPAVLSSLRDALAKAARLAVHLHRIGGRVGLGTDFPVDGVDPGSSVHREMELLVQAGGATPLEALRIATSSSAEILGYGDLLGRVTPGAMAHLVLLERNPLEDISHTRGDRAGDPRREAPRAPVDAWPSSRRVPLPRRPKRYAVVPSRRRSHARAARQSSLTVVTEIPSARETSSIVIPDR